MSEPSVQDAWETLHTKMKNQKFSVDEKTMASRDMIKELTLMDLNAKNSPYITSNTTITDETALHFQKLSYLCVYFATMSALRHEMKKIFKDSRSAAINIRYGYPTDYEVIPIPDDKSIDELFEEKEFQFFSRATAEKENFPNALSFERMLSVLLGCVSPRTLSGLVQTNNYKIIFYAF